MCMYVYVYMYVYILDSSGGSTKRYVCVDARMYVYAYPYSAFRKQRSVCECIQTLVASGPRTQRGRRQWRSHGEMCISICICRCIRVAYVHTNSRHCVP